MGMVKNPLAFKKCFHINRALLKSQGEIQRGVIRFKQNEITPTFMHLVIHRFE